jgi:hypothetical protein
MPIDLRLEYERVKAKANLLSHNLTHYSQRVFRSRKYFSLAIEVTKYFLQQIFHPSKPAQRSGTIKIYSCRRVEIKA